ncbi:acetylxylan esterase [Georgenia sp. TF02-10]|uniref:acetylxylan esterase n=1 Tax=Georgenia sp. TF02-10 TaxID=2917725 RepID=UPI001FA6E4A2|nr:acetylxylan esterase [Georgenia sp. TF02-10]UNX54497.1 acetylxylan esterase [Georgenia sp. TF02-10]
MPQFDLPLSELERYAPPHEEAPDFDEFWRRTLAEQDERHPLEVTCTPVDTGLTQVATDDVTFTGFGGQPIKAWLHRPAGATEPLGCVVTYIGYGGGRGLSHEHTLLAQAGHAVLVMDNRGQGTGNRVGDTGDAFSTGASAPGFLTSGIDSPETYYYRRLFTDAVRAVQVARRDPRVDPGRVMVSGGSQGGAISLAAAALSEGLRGAIVDVPFLAHVRRATELTDAAPYSELVRYLHAHRDRVERTFRTLSYFDGVGFAARVTVPGLFSVGLRDEICPPSAVYAAFNAYAGEKEIKVYAYNGHEHGGSYQEAEHIRFARRVLG